MSGDFLSRWSRRKRQARQAPASPAEAAPAPAEPEITPEELKEVAVFLTHYLGFPLGSKLDGAVSKVVRNRKKAAEKGSGEDRKGNVNAAVKMHSGKSLDDE